MHTKPASYFVESHIQKLHADTETRAWHQAFYYPYALQHAARPLSAKGCEATCSFRHFTLHRKKAWRAPTRCSAYIWLRFQYSRETNRTSGPLLTTMRETSQPSTTVAPRVPTRFQMNRHVEVLHCLFLFFISGSFVLAGPKTRLFHARSGIA